MGFIIDSERMYIKYRDIRNQKYFVDKSNIINIFNKLISKDNSKYVCITKPRRFGKTSIAAMLVNYYSKGIESENIFNKLKVSKGRSSKEKKKKKEIKQYKIFQGKYHTLYFDFSDVEKYKTLNDYLNTINRYFKNDIKEIYRNSQILENYEDDIQSNLINLFLEKKEQFILIIDEWDYIIANKLFTSDERKEYLVFLKTLIKDQLYIAFTYMTGILPIAKNLSQSKLNCFNEYSMIEDKKYYKYFGFTKKEVLELCEKNKKIKYKDLKNWYNGYKSYNGKKIFNTWSVIQALSNNDILNYWTNTGHINELKYIIDLNLNGIKNEILDLILGKQIEISLLNYGAEDIQNEINEEEKEKKEDVEIKIELYSKMVTFGFLTYNDGKISIPNKELKEKFIELLNSNNDLRYFHDLMQHSDKMLKETLNKNLQRMKEILEYSHMKKIMAGDKIDHGNLKRVIDYAYFSAHKYYDVKEEKKNGYGEADFIFYPLKKYKKERQVIIIELKLNKSANNAITQIKKKKYFFDLDKKGYLKNVLLVGINYNNKNKDYTCKIEEYDSSKFQSEDKNNVGKKRKNESDESQSDEKYKKIKKK